MNSVDTVPLMQVSGKRRSQLSVRVLADDSLLEFARIAVQGRARRIFIVSPWVSSPTVLPPLESMARHVKRVAGRLIIVTRFAGEALVQRAAIGDLLVRGASVYELPDLHAKMCVAELAGGRLAALVGSANMTTSSRRLREAGLLVVARRYSRLGRDLEDQVQTFKSSAARIVESDLVLYPSETGIPSLSCFPSGRAS